MYRYDDRGGFCWGLRDPWGSVFFLLGRDHVGHIMKLHFFFKIFCTLGHDSNIEAECMVMVT